MTIKPEPHPGDIAICHRGYVGKIVAKPGGTWVGVRLAPSPGGAWESKAPIVIARRKADGTYEAIQ
jgi:hypothetical protein